MRAYEEALEMVAALNAGERAELAEILLIEIDDVPAAAAVRAPRKRAEVVGEAIAMVAHRAPRESAEVVGEALLKDDRSRAGVIRSGGRLENTAPSKRPRH